MCLQQEPRAVPSSLPPLPSLSQPRRPTPPPKKQGTMTRREIEAAYAMSRRIEAEERALDAACLVFTSTHQEVKDQWGLYDG
jgi:hypothetical protein